MQRREFLFCLTGLILGNPMLLAADAADRHIVRSGETLTSIAKLHGTTVESLMAINGLKNDRIVIGQSLRLPNTSAVLAPVRSANRSIRINQKKWKYLVIHHSATDQGSARSFDRVDRQHGMKNGLAYHFVIGNGKGCKDGLIEVGSRWKNQLHGGHVSRWEYNNHGIGICLVGNFEKGKPTANQHESLKELISYLGGNLLDNRYRLMVHKEINPTLCPGRHFPTQHYHKLYN
jgi:LysM repeat protein